jgi:hypothetical protein
MALFFFFLHFALRIYYFVDILLNKKIPGLKSLNPGIVFSSLCKVSCYIIVSRIICPARMRRNIVSG